MATFAPEARKRSVMARPMPCAPPVTAATQVLQVHNVSDLVKPPGDKDAVADLADEVRSSVALLYGSVDPDAAVYTHGTEIVVMAVPHVQARISNFLSRKRAGVTPNGL